MVEFLFFNRDGMLNLLEKCFSPWLQDSGAVFPPINTSAGDISVKWGRIGGAFLCSKECTILKIYSMDESFGEEKLEPIFWSYFPKISSMVLCFLTSPKNIPMIDWGNLLPSYEEKPPLAKEFCMNIYFFFAGKCWKTREHEFQENEYIFFLLLKIPIGNPIRIYHLLFSPILVYRY